MATQNDTVSALSDGLSSEMRRGLVTVAVLAACRTPQYGYYLKQKLDESRIEVNEGTLYPLMRRLEAQGLLTSEWQIHDGERPRRYYTLAPLGRELLPQLREAWQAIARALEALLEE